VNEERTQEQNRACASGQDHRASAETLEVFLREQALVSSWHHLEWPALGRTIV
jgi:hypothetical protein